MMRLSQALFLAYNVSGFTLAPLAYRFQPFRSQTTDNDAPPPSWFNCGLLISSWTDGVANNPQALQFLKKSLACSLLSALQHDIENAVETSVIQSPCCGPDTDKLSKMETVDEILATIQNDTTANVDDLLQQLSGVPMNIRVLYIPTAMYALRADSNNTPGKQRQRARADGKKRRTQVVRTIQKLFPKHAVSVSTVTLDLDDGSVKQPEGSDGFPQVSSYVECLKFIVCAPPLTLSCSLYYTVEWKRGIDGLVSKPHLCRRRQYVLAASLHDKGRLAQRLGVGNY